MLALVVFVVVLVVVVLVVVVDKRSQPQKSLFMLQPIPTPPIAPTFNQN